MCIRDSMWSSCDPDEHTKRPSPTFGGGGFSAVRSLKNPSHRQARVRNHPNQVASTTARERLTAASVKANLPERPAPPRSAPPRSDSSSGPSHEIRTHDFGKESSVLTGRRGSTTFGAAPRCAGAGVTTSSTGLVCAAPERPRSSQPATVLHEPRRMSIAEMQRQGVAAVPPKRVADTVASASRGGGAAPAGAAPASRDQPGRGGSSVLHGAPSDSAVPVCFMAPQHPPTTAVEHMPVSYTHLRAHETLMNL
eukprot:956314-Prymnesium_polylepis.1